MSHAKWLRHNFFIVELENVDDAVPSVQMTPSTPPTRRSRVLPPLRPSQAPGATQHKRKYWDIWRLMAHYENLVPCHEVCIRDCMNIILCRTHMGTILMTQGGESWCIMRLRDKGY